VNGDSKANRLSEGVRDVSSLSFRSGTLMNIELVEWKWDEPTIPIFSAYFLLIGLVFSLTRVPSG
jgi:hypothetical protein